MSEPDEIRLLRDQVAQLTARVFRLEQQAGTASSSANLQPKVENSSTETGTPGAPVWRSGSLSEVRPQATPLRPMGSVAPRTESLESRIGSRWLNRVGVVAVLVGVSYSLKLAFDNGWVTPGLRVLIGLLAGLGLCLWSERFRGLGSLAFSYSLKAVGVGILYLTVWASFQIYQLVPGAIAFVAMVLITGATAGLAIAKDAELLAGLALLGGLLTPVLCGSHENHEAVLFLYLLMLSVGAFALQRVKHWPRILLGAFVGSTVIASAWFSSYYTDEQFAETLLFFTLLFALFAVAPLFSILAPERDRPTRQTGFLLTILNAAAYFAAIYSQLLTAGNSVQSRAAAYAFGLAVVYAALAVALDRRVSEHPGVERLLPVAHYGLAITFLTVGIALKLHQHWITLAWLVEGALLFWAGASAGRRRVKLFSAVVLALGILRLLTLDLFSWGVQEPILNARLATFVVAIGALLWIIYLDYQSDERTLDGAVLATGVVLLNALALLAAGLEVHDIFQPMIRGTVVDPRNPASYDVAQARHGLVILRNFSYSALIMFDGAALMWLGFTRRSALLRWQAILLIGATVIKVFLFDISMLDHGWRVLSFMILGALLLVISYAYQRDWLGLQRGHPE